MASMLCYNAITQVLLSEGTLPAVIRRFSALTGLNAGYQNLYCMAAAILLEFKQILRISTQCTHVGYLFSTQYIVS